MIRVIKVLITTIVFFFGLLFFIQNNEVLNHTFSLSLNLYGTPFSWKSTDAVPYYYPILIAFALGAFITALYFFTDVYKFFKAARRSKKLAMENMLYKRIITGIGIDEALETFNKGTEKKLLLAIKKEVTEKEKAAVQAAQAAKKLTQDAKKDSPQPLPEKAPEAAAEKKTETGKI